MMGDGVHLIIDGLARKKLTEGQVREFIHTMPSPEYLDMTIVTDEYGHPVMGVKRFGKGWRGWCIIAESHIIIHSNGIEVHADIFSCKPFDPETVVRYCREYLGLEQVQEQVIHRGRGAMGVN